MDTEHCSTCRATGTTSKPVIIYNGPRFWVKYSSSLAVNVSDHPKAANLPISLLILGWMMHDA